MTLEELKSLDEKEDKVEFKEAKHNYPLDGGDRRDPKDRRKCVLGYIVALSNEGGGRLILGMADKKPHEVVGSDFAKGKEGELVDKIYNKLAIRVDTSVLYENDKRVLVIEIPSRPTGDFMKFEGIGLMRTGDSLRDMSNDVVSKILSEREPDFSARICDGLKIDDLDTNAITILKDKYAKKQANTSFLALSDQQILTDLKLLKGNKLTYAALILLGKKEAIIRYLPQARTTIEYRRSDTQIPSDARIDIQEPLYIAIDEIWNYINQPAGNPQYHIRQGPYIFDFPYFNEEVIREGVLNAITHRDYTATSNVVIKQFPEKIEISNPGGFPYLVTIENLIYVDSTPRNELLSAILLKTGLVEKSGQGVDKIYKLLLSEGKGEPDYSESDNFRVCLKIPGKVRDEAFIIFIDEEQRKRDEYNKLGVVDIISLYKIKNGTGFDSLKDEVVQKLLDRKLIKDGGEGSKARYILSDRYVELAHKIEQAKKIKQIKILALTAIPATDTEDQPWYEQEQDALLEVFKEFDREKVFFDMPDPVKSTLEEIRDHLEDGHHDILLLSAHGGIDEKGAGFLCLEDHRGNLEKVTGEELIKVLNPTPKIVILSASHSARQEPDLMPAARVLYEAGIDTVIGMKKAVSHLAAIEFNAAFFNALCRMQTVEQAFESGKQAILMGEQRRLKEIPGWVAVEEYEIPQLLAKDEKMTVESFSDHRIEAPGRPESHHFLGAKYLERGFIGRRQVLRDIFKSIESKPGALVLKGPGGIGKSTLATRTAVNLRRKGYDFIVVQGETTIEQILETISKKAAAMGVKGAEEIYAAHAEPKEKLAWFLDAFLLKQKLVIILDNFEENQEEEKAGEFKGEKGERLKKFLWYFRDNLKHHDTFLLFSTRYTLPGFDTPEMTKNIPEFTPVEFRKMLLNTRALKRLEGKSAKNLIEDIGGNPRALELLDSIAYKKYRERGFTWEQLNALIPELRERIIAKKGKGDDFTPLFLETLVGYLSETQRRLLDILSVYREPVPREAAAAQEVAMEDDDCRKLEDLSLMECIAREDMDLYYVHRLTARYLLQQMEEAERKRYHQKAAGYFAALRDEEGKVYLQDLIEARWHFLQAGEWDQGAEITFELGDYLSLRGYPQWAMELFQELELDRLNETNKIVTYGQMGSLHQDFGEYDKALDFHSRAYEISQKNNDLKNSATALHQIGNIYCLKGDYDAALKEYQKSLEIDEKIGDIIGVAYNLHQTGMIYQDKGDYDAALKQYRKSMEMKEKVGDIKGVSSSLHQIGMIYQLKGDYDAALTNYQKAKEVFEKIGDIKGVASSLHQIGMIYQEKGDYDAALTYYQKSLEIKEKIGDIKGVSDSLHNIGAIYQEKGDYDAALRNYQQALEIFKKIGDIASSAMCMAQIGTLYLHQDKFETALAYFIQAFQVFAKIGSPYANQAGRDIARVREKMTEEKFDEILKEFNIS